MADPVTDPVAEHDARYGEEGAGVPRSGRGRATAWRVPRVIAWAATVVGLAVEIVRRPAGQVGFQVLPRRWAAVRTFAWINRCRRTVRDYERLPAHHAAMVQWSMVIVMTRRLARHRRIARQRPPIRAA
jgi:hypothetical protein